MTAVEVAGIKPISDRISANISKVIVGKEPVVRLLLAAFFAGGHVLLEDVPGTGKTVLAKSLAKSIGADFKRVQFTPDLLPSDLTGINYYNQKLGEFTFRKGPAFTHILLADEINRATPRTQSSLLECMEERQITADGVTHRLEEPYFVIATQNPVETQGTFPLPEAQLDRFLIKTSVGYPQTGQAADILGLHLRQEGTPELAPVCTLTETRQAIQAAHGVHVHADLLRYIVGIVERTRENPSAEIGVSPRGSIAMLRCAQAFAAVSGRAYVTPEDVKTLAPFVFAHRIVLRDDFRADARGAEAVVAQAVADTPVPTEQWQ